MISKTQLLHFIFIVFFISLPFYPPKYMCIVRWIPLLLIINWFVFNGCPFTNIDKDLDDQIFSQVLVKPFIELDRNRAEILTYIILFIVFFFCNRKYYIYFNS